MSRMNDCNPLGRTGYPFTFAIKVDAGMNKCLMGSAAQRLNTPGTDGRGGMRSRAIQRRQVRHKSWTLTTPKAIHLRLSAGCKHRWTVWHPTFPMWHSAQPPKLLLMARPWVPVSESASMARRKAGPGKAVDHTVGRTWSGSESWFERWRGHRWEDGLKIACMESARGRC